ncbi:MAG: hypothetical protein K2L07_11320 [Lachnospiraceae bacterium]|nr:hypothetical protein [Lachnospiraceae bacterium]
MELDEMLKTAYSKEKVPEDINIRLKNQYACRVAMEEKSISFWWLPAMLSTILAVAGLAISLLVYLIIQMKSADYIMPNLVHLISKGFLQMELMVTVFQIGISWVFTVIGLWKLNFRKRAHIL